MAIFDLDDVKSALKNDAAFRLSTRFLTGRIRLNIGDDSYVLIIEDGEFVDFVCETDGRKTDVVFSGDLDSWKKALQEITPPGCQSPLYYDGRSGLRVEGDWVGAIGPLARPIRELFRILRAVVTGKPTDQVLPEVDREFDATVGRYTYLRVGGTQYRIYFEEAGQGEIPLLLQHTAGADSRQARHLLEDPDFQKKFRIIAYDLPFHGRSLPPTSHKWWEDPYLLKGEFLIEFVLAFCERLNLDRPIFMGSAMGGMLGLDLAYHHPEKFRGVICLNAGPPPAFDDAALRQMASFSSPRVGNQYVSTIMMANMAGTSPEIFRRELGWIYSQAAPGIAEGAVYYYHARNAKRAMEEAAAIDTKKVPVYLFTGQDDLMANDWGTAVLAKAMGNYPFKILQRLGHFGPAENPEAFKADIWPALEEIVSQSDKPA